MSKKVQRNLTLILTSVVLLLMIGSYVSMQNRMEPLTSPQFITSFNSPSLIVRTSTDVSEISFYFSDTESEGVRTYLTPQGIDEEGRVYWEYSDSRGYRLSQFRLRDKARAAWELRNDSVAHEKFTDLELAQFGLEPPILTVQITYHDFTNHTIKLGGETPAGGLYFFMLDDRPEVFLMSENVAHRLKFGVADMLELSLPPVHVQHAEYIRIAGRDVPPLVMAAYENSPIMGGLSEIGGEQLIMQEPFPGLSLSHSRLLEYVIYPMSQVRFLELAALHPYDLAPFGLDTPSLEFEFRTAQQNDIHLLFGDTFTRGNETFIYVKDITRPHVFVTYAAHAKPLQGLQPLDIAERALALIPITDVEFVTIETSGNTLVLTMNHIPDTFDIAPEVNGIPVETAPFRRAFVQILNLRADAEIDLQSLVSRNDGGEGFGRYPEITITHHRINNPNTEIRMFNYNANFLAVSIDGNDPIFAISRRNINQLVEALELLK